MNPSPVYGSSQVLHWDVRAKVRLQMNKMLMQLRGKWSGGKMLIRSEFDLLKYPLGYSIFI